MYAKYFLPLFLITIISLLSIFYLHPAAITLGGWQGPGLITVLAVTLGVYLVLMLRTPDNKIMPATVIAGYLMGLFWVTEILVGNLNLHLSPLLLNLFYRLPILLVVLVNTGIGMWATIKLNHFSSSIIAGVQSGLISGLMALTTLVSLLLFTLPLQLADQQNTLEFLRSGETNFPAFVVQGYIFAGLSHLWIGLVGGAFFSFIGGVIVVLLRGLKKNK